VLLRGGLPGDVLGFGVLHKLPLSRVVLQTP
jgi:hypothetical protein